MYNKLVGFCIAQLLTDDKEVLEEAVWGIFSYLSGEQRLDCKERIEFVMTHKDVEKYVLQAATRSPDKVKCIVPV